MLSPDEEATKKVYDLIADDWAALRDNSEFWRQEFDFFKSLLPIGGRVIDIGCGGGRDSNLFLENGFGYLGVDVSKK